MHTGIKPLAGHLSCAPGLSAASRARLTELKRPVEEAAQAPAGGKFGLAGAAFAACSLFATLAPNAAAAEPVEPVDTVLTTDEDHSMIETESIGERIKKIPFDGEIYRREGTLGDMQWEVRAGEWDIDPKLSNLGVEVEFDPIWGVLKKTEQVGDWEVTQGFQGGIRGEYRVGFIKDERTRLDLTGAAFKRWSGQVGDYDARFGVAAVANYDFLEGTPVTGIHAEQRFEGNEFQFWGKDFETLLQFRERADYHFNDSEMVYSAEVFTGIGHEFKMTLLGREADLRLEAGPEFDYNTRDGFDVGAKVRLRVNADFDGIFDRF